tara:strand:+ start:33 stop:458 length:426 start_codon:yes stop_codon:yes gene_type:complete
MLNLRIILIVGLICFSLNGCGKENEIVELHLKSKEMKVSVDMLKLEKSKKSNYSLIYGTLTVTPILPVKSYIDLTCFQLMLGSETTTSIYIDSVASFNPERMIFSQDESMNQKVYWNFNSQIEPEQINELTLVNVKNSCLH